MIQATVAATRRYMADKMASELKLTSNSCLLTSCEYTLMDSNKKEPPRIKETVEVTQGIVNIFRDLSIFSAVALLILVPKFFNQKLSEAGFVEGHVGGFKWQKQLEKTDTKLIEAAKTGNVLAKKLEQANNTIELLKSKYDLQDARLETQIKQNEVAIGRAKELNPGIQSTLKENAPLLSSKIKDGNDSLLKLVNDYSIQIFFNENISGQKKEAFEIKEGLVRLGVKSPIDVRVRPKQLDKASSNQIRYYDANERDVAYALQEILAKTDPGMRFNLQTVYTPSPGSVSIFLKS